MVVERVVQEQFMEFMILVEAHGKGLAGYIANGNENLKAYGESICYDKNTLIVTSSKYITVYPFDASMDNTEIEINSTNLNIASTNNYKKNLLIYGDGIREVSTQGTGNTLWYEDYSYYPGLYHPFSIRGDSLGDNSGAGLFCFDRNNICNSGFRVVLIVS